MELDKVLNKLELEFHDMFFGTTDKTKEMNEQHVKFIVAKYVQDCMTSGLIRSENQEFLEAHADEVCINKT